MMCLICQESIEATYIARFEHHAIHCGRRDARLDAKCVDENAGTHADDQVHDYEEIKYHCWGCRRMRRDALGEGEEVYGAGNSFRAKDTRAGKRCGVDRCAEELR
eukprot:763979-Hanusia_phi.AAC.1